MVVTIRKSTIIQPFEETPKCTLWTSSVDQLFRKHMPSVYFYKPNGSSNFFDVSVLKDALSKVLVTFYPIAGRLKWNKDGRGEIECNGEGVLYIEAETDSVLEDFGDFTPTMDLRQLIPRVDDLEDPSSPPIALLQVTYFKCGAVALGVAVDHTVTDGASGTHFINSWSEIARGLDVKIQPFVERTILRARDPPITFFPHIEHDPSPPLKLSHEMQDYQKGPIKTAVAMLKISRDQINKLKAKCREDSNLINFSTYEVLAAHIWRCACKARSLDDDQDTKLSIATDGRSRLYPPLPSGYLGNAIFHMTPMAKSGDLLSKPLFYTVKKIHDTIVRADDEYIRSAIDFLELHSDLKSLIRGPDTFKCPNMAVTSWCRMPIHDADFGWGRPVFMGPGAILYEGLGFILPNTTKDGSVSFAISLQSGHMALFKEYLYDL